MTILVPWASAESYLDVEPVLAATDPMYDFTNPQSLALNSNRKSFNGLIGAHVLAPLVAPTESTTVRVLVFLSGCEDMEFQEPGNAFANYMFSGWAPQSGKESDLDLFTGNAVVTDSVEPRSADIVGTQDKAMVDKLAAIHYGERIVSLRQLIKRYVHHSHIPIDDSADFGISNWIMSDFPSYKGWSTSALYDTAAGDKFNYARDSYLAYFSQAFLGFRGSIRQKYILNVTSDGSKNYQFYASRTPQSSEFSSHSTILSTNKNRVANMINNMHDARLGTAGVVPEFNNVLEFETPHYSPKRFFFAQWLKKYSNLPEFELNFNNHMVTIIGL